MDPLTYIGTTQSASTLALDAGQRARHIALFGATGVGKSTLLLNLVAQDIARGDGLLLLDPRGDLAERALSLVPRNRNNQVCYINLSDLAHPVGLNLLEDVAPDARALIVDGVVSAMRSIWSDSWGPRLEQILRHGARALLETPNASIVLLPRLLTDPPFRASVLRRVSHPLTRSFFETRFNGWRDDYREQAIDPVLNKIDAFLFSEAIKNVIGQASSTLHLEQAMERQRIVIANLSKGLVGETNAYLMGALLLARAQAAAMGRAAMPEGERRPFHILIDEAQNFGVGMVGQLLSEARKYGVTITIATQFLDALPDAVRASVLANVGTLIAFRVGHDDALALAPEFDREHQAFNPHMLQQLATGEAMVRVAASGGALVSLPEAPEPVGDAERVRRQSRLHYGRPREAVESKIIAALTSL